MPENDRTTEKKERKTNAFQTFFLKAKGRAHEDSYYYDENGECLYDVNRTFEGKRRRFHMNQNLLAFFLVGDDGCNIDV